jgi:TM2 domain-containing membrane protein YozV
VPTTTKRLYKAIFQFISIFQIGKILLSETIQKGPDEKYCSECGSIIKAKAEICPKCGVRQALTLSNLRAVAPNGKSKLAAILFAVFLGSFGFHKFYLGSVGMGVLYLIFCWTFIPSVLGFIDAILLLIMSDEDFNRKYGTA